MKKLYFVLIVVFIFGAVLFVNNPIFAAETPTESAELTTESSFLSTINSSIARLFRRVGTLEKQVVELFDLIANIELIPGPVGPQGEIGLAGPQGEQGPVGLTGPAGTSGTGLHLYDANGLNLGVLISVGDVSNLRRIVSYLPDTNVFLSFRQESQTRTVFMDNTSAIYFPFDNCTGNPYSTGTENPGATIIGNSGRVFKYTNQPLVQGNNSWSVLFSSGCVNGQGPSQLYGPLEEVSLPFSLPPAWPLHVQ